MVKPKQAKQSKKELDKKNLTEVETELMIILWDLQEGTVNDVLTALPSGRDLAYTSVSTILRILESKGVLKTRKEGRGHVYIPLLRKEDFEKNSIDYVVKKIFSGQPYSLVKQLVSSNELSNEQISELKNLLNQLENQKTETIE